MKCRECGTETKYFKQIFANGTKHITERCPICGTTADPKRPFLPAYTVADIDSLPTWGVATEYVQQQQELAVRSKPKPVYFKLNLRSAAERR